MDVHQRHHEWLRKQPNETDKQKNNIMTEQTEPKKKRNRSKTLDHNIVRQRLKEKEIYTLDQFVEAFVIYFDIKSLDSSIPRKAWNGDKIDNNKVLDVAQFLGVNHYTELMTFSASMWWDELIADTTKHDFAFEVDFSNKEGNVETDEWRNVDFGNLQARAEQEQAQKPLKLVSINDSWQLQLYGEQEDTFAVFLQSDKKITQIAPLSAHGCDCKIGPYEQVIEYPQGTPLDFDTSEGIGWRRFIVIRSKHLPLAPRDLRNASITSQELDYFARRLLDQKDNQVTVHLLEFNLIDPTEMLNTNQTVSSNIENI